MKSLLVISALIPMFLSLLTTTPTPTPAAGSCALAYQDSKQVDVIQVINVDTSAVLRSIPASGLLSPSGSVSVTLFPMGEKHMMKIAQVTGLGFQRLIDSVDGDVLRVAWSPDSQQLAFIMSKNGTQSLYTVKPTGANLIQISKETTGVDYPVWSTDGTQLRYLVVKGTAATLAAAKLGDKNSAEQTAKFSDLTTGPFALSTDGKTIFYAGMSEDKPTLFVQTDGNAAKVLASVEKPITEITLEPSGKRLALGLSGQIAIVNTDGSGLQVLSAEGSLLSWQCGAIAETPDPNQPAPQNPAGPGPRKK